MKVLAIVLSAPLLLIGAAYPETPAAGDAAAEAVAAAPVAYRPCRPGPGDDRCIQLYERGVRASYAEWRRERGVEPAETQVAMGGPVEPRHHHRQRHSSREAAPQHYASHDPRCVESDPAGGEARGM